MRSTGAPPSRALPLPSYGGTRFSYGVRSVSQRKGGGARCRGGNPGRRATRTLCFGDSPPVACLTLVAADLPWTREAAPWEGLPRRGSSEIAPPKWKHRLPNTMDTGREA